MCRFAPDMMLTNWEKSPIVSIYYGDSIIDTAVAYSPSTTFPALRRSASGMAAANNASSNAFKLIAGPEFVAYSILWCLQGVLSIQVYMYYIYFPRDKLIYKLLVYGICTFEWVQAGLITSMIFDIFVDNFGNVSAFDGLYTGWFSTFIMCGIVSATVQVYFAWRIAKLAKSRTLGGIIVLLALAQAGGAFACGIKEKMSAGTPTNLMASTPELVIWLVGSALVDVVIAASMTIVMLQLKTGFKNTDTLVNKIVRLVVETGTLTATFAILDIAFCLGYQGTLVYGVFGLPLNKLYANTFLTNMLSRAFFQRSWEEDGHISLSFVGSQTIGGGASAGVGDLTAMNKSYALDGTVKTSGPQQDGAAASTSSDQESGNATNLRFEARGENECILDVHT